MPITLLLFRLILPGTPPNTVPRLQYTTQVPFVGKTLLYSTLPYVPLYPAGQGTRKKTIWPGLQISSHVPDDGFYRDRPSPLYTTELPIILYYQRKPQHVLSIPIKHVCCPLSH